MRELPFIWFSILTSLALSNASTSFSFGKGGFRAAIKYLDTEPSKCLGPKEFTTPDGEKKTRVELTEDCTAIYRLLPDGKLMDDKANQCLNGESNGYVLYQDCSISLGQKAWNRLTRKEFDFGIYPDQGSKICPRKEEDSDAMVFKTCGYHHLIFDAPGITFFDNHHKVSGSHHGSNRQFFEKHFILTAATYEKRCKDLFGKRLCTAAEICPSGPGMQSYIGDSTVISEGGASRWIPISKEGYVHASTCEVRHDWGAKTQILCCPMEYPKPKLYVEDGVGYLIHRSGKCVRVDETNKNLQLQDTCVGKQSIFHWASSGQMRTLMGGDEKCVKLASDDEDAVFTTGDCDDESDVKIARFQFTDKGALQDLTTGRCVVPRGSTPEERLDLQPNTELKSQQDCSEDATMFLFHGLQGIIKHVRSEKCIAYSDGSFTVKKANCKEETAVFYKVKYQSQVLHLVSGKCLQVNSANELSLDACSSSEEDVETCFKYENGKLLTCEDNKCITRNGNGLSISSVCNTDASTFEFQDPPSSCKMPAPQAHDSPDKRQIEDCACAEGYEMRNSFCFPIDSCKINNGGCTTPARCHSTGPGTNICTCPPGKKLDQKGISCTDCLNNNCYEGCDFYSDDELVDALSRQASMVLRFSHVSTCYLKGILTRDIEQEVVIYTQQLTLSKSCPLTLLKRTKLAIFVNELLKEDGARIAMKSEDIVRSERPGELEERRSTVTVEDQLLICDGQDRFYDEDIHEYKVEGSWLGIYNGTTGIPFTCTANYNYKPFVNLEALTTKKDIKFAYDIPYLTLCLVCSKVMAQDKALVNQEDGKGLLMGSIPVKMVQYVIRQADAAQYSHELTADDKEALSSIGLKGRDQLEAMHARAEGTAMVPYLSLKAHEKILTLLKDDAKMAIYQYDKYRHRSQELEEQKEATKAMTHVMKTIISQNDRNIDAIQQELDIAMDDVGKLQKKLDEAKVQMDTAKKAYEEGVRNFQKKMLMNAIFSCIGAVASIFSGGAGSIKGLAGMASLPAEMSKLSRTIVKISAILESIKGIAEFADKVRTVVIVEKPLSEKGADKYFSGSAPDAEKTVSLAVQVKEWDVFVADVEGALSIGTAATIVGAGGYVAALRTVAVWGKAIHEKSIAIDGLSRKLAHLRALKKDQKASEEKIETIIKNADDQRGNNADWLVEMALQKERLRVIMVDTLLSFCDAYFYNWLSPCPVIPVLDDDLDSLHSKVNQGLTAVIKAVDNFAPFIAEDFQAEKIIKDGSDCDAPPSSEKAITMSECKPITALKEGKVGEKSFVFELERDDRHVLKGYERVHINEIEVYLEGATVEEGESITVYVSFSGMMKDLLKGREYKFIGPPRVSVFSYIPSKGNGKPEITQRGKVANKFQEYYDGIAAMTSWIVSIPKDKNHPSLSLDHLTEVRMVFKGNRVSANEVGLPKVDAGRDKAGMSHDETSSVPANDEEHESVPESSGASVEKSVENGAHVDASSNV